MNALFPRAERRDTLKSGCRELVSRSAVPAKNFLNVIVMQEKRLAWCPVFKASSSTWLKYLFETSSLSQVGREKRFFL